MRLRQAHPGSNGMKERDMENTIQELEARVAMLESQKGALQSKLSLAKQHILDLGGRTPYKFSKGMHCSLSSAPLFIIVSMIYFLSLFACKYYL